MSTYNEKQAKAAFKLFKNKKILDMKTLVTILTCSERTVQRNLKKWKAHTSYNKNCRYYTLPDIPSFNQHGIWKYKDIFFSKYGNLKDTVINVVSKSESGLNAKEISEIIGLSSYTFLSHFKNDSKIQRKKYQGIFIYFSSDPDNHKKQKYKRDNFIQSSAILDLPTDAEAITILVELIKNPLGNIDQLTRRVRKKGIPISKSKIFNLLSYHQILKKKIWASSP